MDNALKLHFIHYNLSRQFLVLLKCQFTLKNICVFFIFWDGCLLLILTVVFFFNCSYQLRVREHPVLGPYVEDLTV